MANKRVSKKAVRVVKVVAARKVTVRLPAGAAGALAVVLSRLVVMHDEAGILRRPTVTDAVVFALFQESKRVRSAEGG